MDELIIPYAFTGGMSAKAQEVNANFEQIRLFGADVVNQFANMSETIQQLQSGKADIQGNQGIQFNVARASDSYNAVPLYQLKNLILPFVYIIGGLNIEKTGNKGFTVYPGACYDSTFLYPMQLTATRYQSTAYTTTTNVDVFLVGTPQDGYVGFPGVDIAVSGNLPDIQVGEVYRKIGSFSTDSNGNIDESTIKKEED